MKLVVKVSALVVVGMVAFSGRFEAQDRLERMPGVAEFRKMQTALQGGAFVSGAITPTWAEDSKGFTYIHDGSRFRFDVATMAAVNEGAAPAGAAGGRGGRAGGPPAGGRAGRGGNAPGLGGCPPQQVERGRQAACVGAPDGSKRAFYKDRNIFIANADGTGEKALTTDGSEEKRIKYGTASWVYGEELGQTSAIWWSPDSTKVAFYRFDESKVKDFYLQMSQTGIQSELDVEAYPKAGAPNPVADIFIHDVVAGKTTKVDVRDGRPFTDIPEDGSVFANDQVGHYVYRVNWAHDGSELFMNRTNRRQNKLEMAGCATASGECRVILSEEWPTGWVVNSPPMQWLSDNQRFLWTSERNGFRNLYLYDKSGKLLAPITQHTTFEVVGVTKVDEKAGVVFYTARSGDNWMKVQLHRVGLDGKGDVRLTDPKFTHTVTLSPDNNFIVDTFQTHKDPPASQLLDGSGKVLKALTASNMAKFEQLGLRKSEQFTYLAADGKTTLYGMISFPANFDPAKKYPSLASVYGGPGSAVTNENFAAPNATANYGFLMLQLSSRSAPGQGKRVLDSAYLNLGVTEMDDMALGVKALWTRPYFDKDRVGIYGTSYGGYSSALSLLKYPDVYGAAAASSSVTSWYHYDSIYTERFMWIPQENKAGYEAGNAMTLAKNLTGRLLIYYGTADNNVHPNNSMQLIKALQAAGKSFEVQVGPDAGHTGVNNGRMMEFFIENLVMRPERLRGA
jgi:dipeptidyl-peptidase-4